MGTILTSDQNARTYLNARLVRPHDGERVEEDDVQLATARAQLRDSPGTKRQCTEDEYMITRLKRQISAQSWLANKYPEIQFVCVQMCREEYMTR